MPADRRAAVLGLAVLLSAAAGAWLWGARHGGGRDAAWTEGWTFVSSFHIPRRALAAATDGRYLYVIGGVDHRGRYVKTVEYARIRADGSLSRWRPTAALSTGRFYLAAVYLNGYLYALGGGTGPLGSDNTPTALVERAKVHGDGSLAPWRKQAYMTTPRRGLKAVVYKHHIYAIGGYDGQFLHTTERADLDDHGNIEGWALQPQKSVLERYIHSAAIWHNKIYLLGGHVRNPVKVDYGDVESTTISPAGDLAPWAIEKSVLQVPRFVASAFAMGGYLYILGGHDASRRLRSVEFAKIDYDGHVGRWRYNAPLRLQRSATALAVNGDTVYVLGGMGDGRILNQVAMARLGDRGLLGHARAAPSTASALSLKTPDK